MFTPDKAHWEKMRECKKFQEEASVKLQREHISEIIRLVCSWGSFCFAWIILAIIFKYPENDFSIALISFMKGSQTNVLEAIIWGVIVAICLGIALFVELKSYWGFGLRCVSIVLLTITTVLGLQLGPTAEVSLFATLGKIGMLIVMVYVGASIKMNKLHEQPKKTSRKGRHPSSSSSPKNDNRSKEHSAKEQDSQVIDIQNASNRK